MSLCTQRVVASTLIENDIKIIVVPLLLVLKDIRLDHLGVLPTPILISQQQVQRGFNQVLQRCLHLLLVFLIALANHT